MILLLLFYILIVLCCGILLFFSAYGFFHFMEKRSHGKKENNEILLQGDVIIKKMYSENPFNDCEWMYETVTDVRTNDIGDFYFKSYTSNKDGVRCPEQNGFASEHREGRKYWKKEWELVNHIEL